MIPNGLKRTWQAGRPAINGWLSIGNPFTAEIMAAQGYDSLTVDIQHGFLDYGEARGMMQAVRASGVTIMARVPWLDPGIVMKVLDAGAYGVICPMVSTPDQAARLVDVMRYPPRGSRSFGPTRVAVAAGADYAAHANDEVLAIAMIETAQAVENVEAICATPGLDGVYIGPADLTLGVTQGRLKPGFDREEAEMLDIIQRILAAAKAAGIRAGLHCGTPAYAAKAIGWGFDLVTIAGDTRLLAGAAGASVAEARRLMGEAAQAGTAGDY
jgi:4-hydroxy-2-oxoheptanedioate aldolase